MSTDRPSRSRFEADPLRFLVGLPIVFLALTVGMAMAVFLSNTFYPVDGMGGVGTELTLKNYRKLADPYYGEVMLHTMAVCLVIVLIAGVISYPISLFIARSSAKRATFYFLLVLSSSALSVVVRALGWIGILAENGPINLSLLALGVVDRPVLFLSGDIGVMIGLVHGFVPLFVLTLVPIIQAIDPSLEQAAAGLGAGPWTTLWRITLPLSMPGLVAAGLVTFALCMGSYTTPALLGGGRSAFFPILVYQQVGVLLNYPMGATLALALLVFVLAITWVSIAVSRRFVYGA